MVTRILLFAFIAMLEAVAFPAVLGARGTASAPLRMDEVDLETTNVIRIDTGSETTFRLSFVGTTHASPSGCTVDWGDGCKDVLQQVVKETTGYWYYAYYNATDGTPTLDHAYAQPGRYEVRITGDVQIITPYFKSSADQCVSMVTWMSFARNDADYLKSGVPFTMLASILKCYTQLEFADLSRIWNPNDTTSRTSPITLSGSASSPFSEGWKVVKFPGSFSYMTSTAFRYNTTTTDIHFENTTSEIMAWKISTTSSVGWIYSGYVGKQITIHGTDGVIQYVNGAWTVIPQ